MSLISAVSLARTPCNELHAFQVTTYNLLQRLLEHGTDIVPLHTRRTEALRPADELSVVDAVLRTGVREREPEGEVVGVAVAAEVVVDKAVEALGAEVEPGVREVASRSSSQLLALLLLLLLGETVLCLRDLELALAVEGDEADAEVGASEVDGEVLALLLA